MFKPTKRAAQESKMTEEHKSMRAALIEKRNEPGHKERVAAFNAKLAQDLGKENVTFLLQA